MENIANITAFKYSKPRLSSSLMYLFNIQFDEKPWIALARKEKRIIIEYKKIQNILINLQFNLK